MAREPNNLRLASPLETEPTFTLAFRGYSKREVDHYAHIAETQLQAAISERNELAARLRSVADQLHQAHAELVDLRRRPTFNDKVSFRHLGPRVEQILAEAEKQAEAVRAAAAESLSRERAEVAAERVKINDEFARMVREYEASQQARRKDEEVSIAKRLESVRIEVTEGQAYARKVRSEAEDIVSAAQAEASKLLADAAVQAKRMRDEAAQHAAALRSKAEEDAAAIAHSAEEYARDTREEAEQHAHLTRAAAEQQAHQTTAAAEQAATQIRLHAEQHAAQVRSAAEKHAARLHATLPRTVHQDGQSTMDSAPVSPPLAGGTAKPAPAGPPAPAPTGTPAANMSTGDAARAKPSPPTSPAPAGSTTPVAAPGPNGTTSTKSGAPVPGGAGVGATASPAPTRSGPARGDSKR